MKLPKRVVPLLLSIFFAGAISSAIIGHITGNNVEPTLVLAATLAFAATYVAGENIASERLFTYAITTTVLSAFYTIFVVVLLTTKFWWSGLIYDLEHSCQEFLLCLAFAPGLQSLIFWVWATPHRDK